MIRASILAVVLQLWSLAALSSCPSDSEAQRYLQAIQAMDWTLMESMLAKDAVYTDPTMTYFDREPIHLVGPGRIVDFWRDSSEESGTGEISYTTTQCFETAGYYVFNLDIDVQVAGAFWNVNKESINLPGKLLSIVRVKDGNLAEHHDYVEYSAALDVVNELQQKYGVLTPD